MKAQSKTKTILVALFAAIIGVPAFAATVKADCPVCDAAARQAKALRALHYGVEADRSNGGLLALDALKVVEDFARIPKKDVRRREAFSGVLALAREASPYDGESQIASLLADLIEKDRELKTSYEAYIKSLPAKTSANKADACKTDQLKANVGEALCRDQAGVTGQDSAGAKAEAKTNAKASAKANADASANADAKAKSCETSFVFDDCVK